MLSYQVTGDLNKLFPRLTACDERTEELTAIAASVVEERSLPVAVARSLRGRILFARGQTFSRSGTAALGALGPLADGVATGRPVVEEAIFALSLLDIEKNTSLCRWQP